MKKPAPKLLKGDPKKPLSELATKSNIQSQPKKFIFSATDYIFHWANMHEIRDFLQFDCEMWCVSQNIGLS